MKTGFTLAAITLTALSAAAAAVPTDTIDGIIYAVYPDSTVTIGTVRGPRGASGVITLPEYVNGKPNVSVAPGAFRDNTTITSVIMPSTMTSIGAGAFEGCSSLAAVDLPDHLHIISELAFSGCSGLTSLYIPASVHSMGNDAFSHCSSLRSATLMGPTSIITGTFADCTSLTSVTTSAAVGRLEADAFQSCTALTDWYIENTKVNPPVVVNGAFNGCLLRSITIHAPQPHAKNQAFKLIYSSIVKNNPQIKAVDYRIATGADDAVADSPENNQPARYFTLQGIEVKASQLNPGIYIVRQGAETIKMTVR